MGGSGFWFIEQIDFVGGEGRGTSIALDKNGAVHIVYCDVSAGTLKYASNDGGRWSIKVVDCWGQTGFYPSIAWDAIDPLPALTCPIHWGPVPPIYPAVPSVYSVRLVILAFTLIRAYYKSHAIPNSTHLHLSAEVAQCVISREPLSTIIATRTTFLGGTGNLRRPIRNFAA